MADGYNKAILFGNLGADPELRFTQGGGAALNFRLATTTSYLDKDKVRQERTDWHSCVVWGKRGEALAKILTKGSTVFVEGSIRYSSYDNREGQKVYKTEINVENICLAGGKGGQRHAADPAEDYDRTQEPAGADDFDPGVPAFAPSPPATRTVNPLAQPRTGGGGYAPPPGRGVAR